MEGKKRLVLSGINSDLNLEALREDLEVANYKLVDWGHCGDIDAWVMVKIDNQSFTFEASGISPPLFGDIMYACKGNDLAKLPVAEYFVESFLECMDEATDERWDDDYFGYKKIYKILTTRYLKKRHIPQHVNVL